MRRAFAVILLLMPLVLTSPATAEQSDVLRFEPTPALNVYRSAHYRIHTTLSREEAVPYGRHVDALYEQYVKRFRGIGGQRVEPMPLYLFANESQYDRFLIEHDINATNSGGMFFETNRLRGLATWAHRDNRAKTFEVLQHEGFHQFAHHAFGGRLPVWLNEGLAQYFEDAVVIDGRMTLGLASGARIRTVQSALRGGSAPAIDQLLEMNQERWLTTLRTKPDRAATLYAHAWSLTYFIIHGDEGAHQHKLLDYLRRLSLGQSTERAAYHAFGPRGFSGFASSWHSYAIHQRPHNVSEAAERLAFLGTGLRILAEQGEPMPRDIHTLRSDLRRYGFRLRRTEMGLTRDLSAEQADLFRYTRGEQDKREFVVLDPLRSDLPPRITAPGLKPAPTLIWYRTAEGKLIQQIEYD